MTKLTPDTPATLEAKVDSMQGEARIDALNDLAWELRNTDRTRSAQLSTQALEQSLSTGYAKGESYARLNTGYALFWKSEYAAALEAAQTALAQCRLLGEAFGEAAALNLMGNVWKEFGKHQDSLDAYTESLNIRVRIGDEAGQAGALDNLGLLHRRMGGYETASAYHHQSLEIKRRLGDLWGESATLNNLGAMYDQLGNLTAALDCFFKALTLSEHLQDAVGQGRTLGNIGMIYHKLGDTASALDYYFRALAFLKQAADRSAQGYVMDNIGTLYSKLGNESGALKYHFAALKIKQELGERRGQHYSLNYLGKVYEQLGDTDRALDYYTKALDICRELGDAFGEADTLLEIGILLSVRANLPPQPAEQAGNTASLPSKTPSLTDAIDALELALTAAKAAQYDRFIARSHEALADAYKRQGQHAESRRHHRAAQDVRRKMAQQETSEKTKQTLIGVELAAAREQNADLSADEQAEVKAAVTKSIDQYAAKAHAAQAFARPAAAVSVRTLGAFEAEISGRPVDEWGRKKARDLFKILLIHYQQPVTTDALVEMLWRDSPEKNTDALVMNAVSHLRKALEPDLASRQASRFIKSQDRSYTLDLGESAVIDFIEFKRLIESARRTLQTEGKAEAAIRIYEQAVGLYGGDFLKEDAFEDWSCYERETLQEACIEALIFIAEHGVASGKPDGAIAAKRVLELDRVHEKAYRLLYRWFVESARPADAQKLIAQCRTAFKEELGALPPQSLLTLFNQHA